MHLKSFYTIIYINFIENKFFSILKFLFKNLFVKKNLLNFICPSIEPLSLIPNKFHKLLGTVDFSIIQMYKGHHMELIPNLIPTLEALSFKDSTKPVILIISII